MHVLSDFDGTIVDTENAICTTLLKFAQLHKIETPSREAISGISGKDPLSAFSDHFIESKGHDRLTQEFWNLYQKICKTGFINLIPGVDEFLKEVKVNGKLGVVTNKDRNIALREIGLIEARFGLPKIDFFIGFDKNSPLKRKPDPDMIFAAIKEMGIEKRKTLFIGDTQPDVEAAKNAGIPVIVILTKEVREKYGGVPSWAQKADFVIKHMHEANVILHKIRERGLSKGHIKGSEHNQKLFVKQPRESSLAHIESSFKTTFKSLGGIEMAR